MKLTKKIQSELINQIHLILIVMVMMNKKTVLLENFGFKYPNCRSCLLNKLEFFSQNDYNNRIY